MVKKNSYLYTLALVSLSLMKAVIVTRVVETFD